MSQVSAVRDRAVTINDGVANPVPCDYPELVEAGDILLLMAVVAGASVTATGWTSLGAENFGRGGEMFWRTADGSEGGTTFDIDAAVSTQDTITIVWSIRADLNPGTPEATSVQHSATTDDWNPPSLTPSSGDRLYQWFVAGYLDSSINLTSWDSTLDERIQAAGAGGVLMAGVSAERLLSAATFDPGPSTKSANQEWGAWTVAVPIDQPAAGVFPVVETTSQGSWTSAGTSQTLTLPAGVAVGDLLVATIASAHDITVSITDWTELATASDTGTTNTIRGTMLAKVADGTEGASETVTFSASGTGSFLCRRISGVDNANTEATAAVRTAMFGTSSLWQWPILTPAGGADDILWLADGAIDSTRLWVGWPVNYGASLLSEQDGNLVSEGAGSGVLARNQASAQPELAKANSTANGITLIAAIYPAAAAPAAPTNPAATALSDSSIRVTWDDVADETGYRVERSDDGIGGWADVSGNLAADTVLFDDTGLTASTQFFYRVFAFNAVGDSDPSTVVNATTDAAAGGGNRMGGAGAIRKPPRRN